MLEFLKRSEAVRNEHKVLWCGLRKHTNTTAIRGSPFSYVNHLNDRKLIQQSKQKVFTVIKEFTEKKGF